MMAFQVGGKATREAVFLSNFPITALPGMLIVTALVSIIAVLALSRLLSAKGPGAIIPTAFGVSSILLILEWLVFPVAPRVLAVVFYLHVAAFGAILVSGFWSIVSELFDPRSAKAKFGRLAAGGTLGGLIGGVIAERIGALFSVSAMLPILAGLHVVCALLNRRLRSPALPVPGHKAPAPEIASVRPGLRVLRDVPFVKLLALLVLTGTISESLLDYVLKTQVAAAFEGQQIMRFFAFFYMGISLLTFLIQAAFSRYSLQQFGLTNTMSSLPLMVATGGVASLVWPGLISMGIARGGQSVLRGSLFRSGYELLYAPMSREEKRAAKTIVDVGFDRLGDAVGGGLIRIVLAVGLTAPLNSRVLTILSVALGIVSLLLTRRLGVAYISTLEKSLLNQASELELLDVDERSTRATMLRTLGTVDLRGISESREPERKGAHLPGAREVASSSVANRFLDLQVENTATVRAALSKDGLDPLLVAPAIRLLARDEVSEDAVTALRTVAAASVGQLTDALLNPDEDFAVRRRVPRILAYCQSARSVDGLMRGLSDSRFEVRFSCGRALSMICAARPDLCPASERVYEATLREIMLAQRLSETPRVLDRYDDSVALWNSTDIRLEHIFRLLSLCLPTEPLHVAFRALHTEDAYLKGTALEYLESILPAGIRESIWTFLEGPARPPARTRPAAHVLEDLMQSRQRIELATSLPRSG